jgi:hypothetical protein
MLSGSWPGEIYLFRRKANRTFAAPETIKLGSRALNVGRASAVAAADWDGDGHIDLVIGNIDGEVFLVRNEGGKKLSFAKPVKLSAGGAPIKVAGDAGPCLVDWNGNGKLDLIVGSGSGEVVLFENIGTKEQPQLAKNQVLVSAAPGGQIGRKPNRTWSRTKPAVADWNGDGKLDLIIGDFASLGDGNSRSTHGWVWVYLRKAEGLAAQ